MLSLAAGFGCERDVAVQPGSLRQPGDLGIIGFDRGVSVDVYASAVHPLQPSTSFTPEDVTAAMPLTTSSYRKTPA